MGGDFRFALRRLLRNKAYGSLVCLTLALGIGVTTAVFSVVNTVVLRPLGFDHPERLMVILVSARGASTWFEASEGLFTDWKERSRTFQAIAGARITSKVVSGLGQPRMTSIAATTPNLFTMLGVTPRLGRPFAHDEDEPGRGLVALLDRGFWEREMGADPNVLGKNIRIGAGVYTIIGVIPSVINFRYTTPPDIWVPLKPNRALRGGGDIVAIGRLRPGETQATARAEMRTIMSVINHEHREDSHLDVFIEPLLDWLVGDFRTALLLLLGAVTLLFLICCANTANLVLGESISRKSEMSVRVALGATRSHLWRQALSEGLLVAMLGGVLGIAFCALALRIISAINVIDIPRLREVNIDHSVLLVTLLAVFAIALAFAAISILKSNQGDIAQELHTGTSTFKRGRLGIRLGNTCVVLQMASALMLLMGVGLLGNTVFRLLTANLGFHRNDVVTVNTFLPADRYNRVRALGFQRQLVSDLLRLPGVVDASTSDYTPLESVLSSLRVRNNPAPGADNYDLLFRRVDTHYFSVMGIRQLAGRDFRLADDSRVPVPVILNDAASRLLFASRSSIGRRLFTTYRALSEMDVVGIVGDVRELGVRTPARPQLYLPIIFGLPQYVIARTAPNTPDLIRSINDLVKELDRNVPAPVVSTMDQSFSREVAKPRFYLIVLAALGCIALALAASGAYGMTSRLMATRTREFGIRVALGAGPKDIIKLALGTGIRLVGFGIAAGLAGSFFTNRLLSSILFAVRPNDLVTFASVSLFTACIALLPCYLKARKVAASDPNCALRAE